MRRPALPAAVLAAFLLLTFLLPLGSQELHPGAVLPDVPEWLSTPSGELEESLEARSAVLLDHEAGTLLFAKSPDEVIPPASLTKLMTVHLALEAARTGRFPLDRRVPVPEEAWAENQAPGSSLMFLGPGQRVSGSELLAGLAVSSGNDAAVAVAILVSGSVEAFVEKMNREARRLGYPSLTFNDPAGLSAENRATARELADFASYLIDRHPGILDYFSVPEFTYPKPENFVNGHRESSITQRNRNLLLELYPGADGFKTGFIEASQYNLIGTALRNGRRIVVVLLGVPGSSHAEGGRKRTEEAVRLLDFGYERFELVYPGTPELEPLRVYAGVEERVGLRVDRIAPLALPTEMVGLLGGRLFLEEYLWAPVSSDTAVGRVEYYLDDRLVLARTVRVAGPVQRDTLLGRIYDSLLFVTAPLSDPTP